MFHTTRIHIAQRLAVVVAGAALLVPSASAMPFITDTLAPGGTSASSPHIITDTLAPGGGISEVHRWFVIEHASPAAEPKGYRFITDTLAPGGGASGIVAVPAGNGFSWADAGIGAVVACGLMLLALIGRQLGGRRRRGQLAF
jgi:hypothetical protein